MRIKRVSNGTIYDVIEETEDLYLINRGWVVGDIWEDKNKFVTVKDELKGGNLKDE